MATKKLSGKMKYKRVLLKLSGEMLGGSSQRGIDFKLLDKLAAEIKKIGQAGIQIAIVIGGGNYWRYRDFKDSNIDRVNSDYLGMLATMINSVALQDELRSIGVKVSVLSALPVERLVESFSARRARELMANGEIVICAGGTGNPFCTTDSAAALRAGELECEIILKATNVDYAYDKDPSEFKDAIPFKKISFDEVLERKLGIMDLGAISLAREAKTPIVVFNLNKPQNMLEIVSGKAIGTFIYN